MILGKPETEKTIDIPEEFYVNERGRPYPNTDSLPADFFGQQFLKVDGDKVEVLIKETSEVWSVELKEGTFVTTLIRYEPSSLPHPDDPVSFARQVAELSSSRPLETTNTFELVMLVRSTSLSEAASAVERVMRLAEIRFKLVNVRSVR